MIIGSWKKPSTVVSAKRESLRAQKLLSARPAYIHLYNWFKKPYSATWGSPLWLYHHVFMNLIWIYFFNNKQLFYFIYLFIHLFINFIYKKKLEKKNLVKNRNHIPDTSTFALKFKSIQTRMVSSCELLTPYSDCSY